MQHNGLMETQSRNVPGTQADKRALTESVAYALWQERKRREVPDDPEADWYHAEELITELWNLRPPET
jgi:hypothetical protein